MKILIVGNYRGDRQWSMERFCEMLLRGLKDEGVEVDLVRPVVMLGAFFKGTRGLNKWLAYVDKFVLFRFALRQAIKTRPGCLVHILDQGNGIYAAWLGKGLGPFGPFGPFRPLKGTCIVTCHDLLAIRAARGEFPALRIRWTGRVFQRLILRGLRRAGALVSISGATRRDARRLIGDSIVIPNGVEDFWKPVAPGGGDYLLHVGGDHWYKNRPGVVRLFIDLRKQTSHTPKLIMVGPALPAPLAEELRQAGLDGEVTLLKSLSDEALRALYSKARALVFPSLEEGAGWPILEAQACGCPVVTRRKEPMLETGGDAAIYAGEGEWVRAVAGVLEMDPARRDALVAAGIENASRYSVQRMAREYIELYRRHCA